MFSLEAGVAKKNGDSGNECTAAKDEPLKITGHSLSPRPLLVNISRDVFVLTRSWYYAEAVNIHS